MVLDNTSFEITVFVAVILAGLARTLIPFLSKRQADIAAGLEPRPFTYSYVTTALLATVPVLVGAVLLLPLVLPQVNNSGSQITIFVLAFGIAYTANDLVNRNLPSTGIATANITNRLQGIKSGKSPNTTNPSTG